MILLDNFLTHNLIATMEGPFFLLVYLLYILFIFLLGWFVAHRIHNKLPVSSISIVTLPEPDPYLIAYIRSGVSDTTKLAVYSLMERGYLMSSTRKKEMKIKPGHPPIQYLTAFEKIIFEFAEISRRVEDVVDGIAMLQSSNSIFQKLIDTSNYNELIYTETLNKKIQRIHLVMRCAILFLGGYKLLMALSTGHDNVLFLLILAAASIYLVPKTTNQGRLTPSGEKYLKDLQTLYIPKNTSKLQQMNLDFRMLLVGVLGTYLLKELGYSFLVEYEKSKMVVYSSDGSCGSSCGGGSGGGDGGGSCGGGCGGCGGGD